MNESSLDLSLYLHAFPQIPTTRHIFLERNLFPHAGYILSKILPGAHWLFIADRTTWPLAGPAIVASAQNAGIKTAEYIIEENKPIASDRAIAALQPHLTGITAIVAIGSGTLNDIGKMTAHRAQIPYAVLATAPSMNGYTSSIAALLVDGVKTTQPCSPPVACLGDLDLLAATPYRMIAAGLGDLLSKSVSNADWLLARQLNNGTYSTEAAALIDKSAELLTDVAGKLPARDTTAIGQLMASLCLSGLAMSVAGSSAPASGGEHLISHYLDMTHYALGESNDLHGCQVGVATLATAALYEKLLALDPTSIDVNALVDRHPPWATYEPIVRERFGPLAEAVLPHAKTGYPDSDQLRVRLEQIQEQWEILHAELRPSLRGVAAIRTELLAAECPTTFAQIGVSPERAQRAQTHSKDIRARYTILHLAAELGLAHEWTTGLSHLI
jgi:glycerol-1-phosphate dehydrogenase [NAD(P)+]